jgi:hypothetical protein
MACLQPVPILAVAGVDMGVAVASVDGVVVVVEVREGGRRWRGRRSRLNVCLGLRTAEMK